MPRIKRWFPVSHDINHSATMRELAREFGLAGWRVWFEILSISDRVGEDIDCTSKGALSRLTSAAETRMKVTSRVLQWLLKRNCIATIDVLNHVTRVVNYGDFHRTEERKPIPPDLPDLTRPNRTLKNEEPATPAPSAQSLKAEKKTGLDPAIRDVADRIYFSDRKKFAKLVIWIKEAQRERFSDELIAGALLRFERYAATADPWYPYLDKIIYKLQGDKNARESEAQSEQYKQELADYAQDLKH